MIFFTKKIEEAARKTSRKTFRKTVSIEWKTRKSVIKDVKNLDDFLPKKI